MCTRLAARHRRINELQGQAFCGGVELLCDRGRGGGVIDKNRARLHACKCTVRAQRDRAQVIVVADTAKHDVGLGGGFARRGGPGALEFGVPAVRLGFAAVVDRDLVPRQRQMAGHRCPHDAKAQKGHRDRG